MSTGTIIVWVLVGSTLQQAGAAETGGRSRYGIVEVARKWQLLRDGQPFYIKGAVGWEHFDVLRECGGNSVRTRASKRQLDRAQKYGLVAMAGLPVRGERNGMNWDDEGMVAEQRQRVLRAVEELKGHPALMLWAVGNELDWIPPGRPHSPRLWERLNELAVEIRKIDPDHPVLTVVGTGRFERKIQEMAKQCSGFDLLGINTYGDIDEVVGLAAKYWPKPFVIAEWGPTGHWQVPKTKWRVPIEQSSTEKARAVFDRYTTVIQPNRDRCLGSYVFLWGQKQETTHTWYGMFRDGMRTESVDVMQCLWTGSWPQNRAPAVLELSIEGFAAERQIYLEPGKTYSASVACYDSDYDELTFAWDIRPEVEIPANSYAGGGEKPAKPIPGLIADGHGPRVNFTAPSKDGPYRLFVQIRDGRGHAGYGNVAFYVRSW
ncbi:MAG: hypothetical protein JSU70_10110 [Phycisphaerales bacterium]|nr:MAG: hypothetical protein JSU70_10110 [Phycisphaerales bacterium]